jgi:hypothetical protein
MRRRRYSGVTTALLRLGVIRRIQRTPDIAFSPPEWLGADAVDARALAIASDQRIAPRAFTAARADFSMSN